MEMKVEKEMDGDCFLHHYKIPHYFSPNVLLQFAY